MVDSMHVYDVLRNYSNMLSEAIDSVPPTIEYRDVQRVVVCGMGGSGMIGDLVATLCKRIPVFVIKDYHLPPWVGQDDLVICVSYSGNTEETVELFRQAQRYKALVYAIASGGKLVDLARDGGVAHTQVPQGLPPRFATVHMLVPALAVLQALGLSDAYAHLPRTVSVNEGYAKHLAKQLVGKTPMIYGSTLNKVLATKFKTDINENAKMPAFCNVVPESNHNELNSFEHMTSHFVVLFLVDEHDHPQIQRRMQAAKRILEEKEILVIDVPITHHEPISKLLHGNLLALLVAYFLALEYGVDPGPVKLIERFKEDIARP